MPTIRLVCAVLTEQEPVPTIRLVCAVLTEQEPMPTIRLVCAVLTEQEPVPTIRLVCAVRVVSLRQILTPRDQYRGLEVPHELTDLEEQAARNEWEGKDGKARHLADITGATSLLQCWAQRMARHGTWQVSLGQLACYNAGLKGWQGTAPGRYHWAN